MDCPICGTSQTYETTSMLDTQRHHLCRNGHSFVEVEFTRAEWYVPPYSVMEFRSVMVPARWVDERDDVPVMMDRASVMHVHCGPAAHLPAPPTPEDLLGEAARLYAIRLDLPG